MTDTHKLVPLSIGSNTIAMVKEEPSNDPNIRYVTVPSETKEPMTTTQPKWKNQFNDLMNELFESDENTQEMLNRQKTFISQQLTAFSKEVEGKIMMLFVEVDAGGQVTEKKTITQEEVIEALSNLKKKWGIE